MPTPISKETKRPSKQELTSELTPSQTIGVLFGAATLTRDYSTVGTYRQLRAVRKDPTVSLARGLLISCIRAGSWNVEADEDVDEKVTDFIKHVLPLREDFLYNVIAHGLVDYCLLYTSPSPRDRS